MASIDWTTIEKHLRKQGWSLERTTQGHVRAKPADQSRPLVHYSNSAEPRAIHNTLAQLKASGFVWPPVEPKRMGDADHDWIEIHNARVATEELERQMAAAANVLVPPPPSTSFASEYASHKTIASFATPPETEEQRVNRMFEELKEAKLHATLCKEQEEAAAAKAAAAQQVHETALRELSEAQKALRDKKAAFDQMFSEPALVAS